MCASGHPSGRPKVRPDRTRQEGYRSFVTDTGHDIRNRWLERVFAIAAEARADGDHPFGALLVVEGLVVAEAKNRVNSNTDITAHAELTLVRNLEREGKLPLLASGDVYASCEPCPMCVGAMFWAGVKHVVYGLSATSLNQLATAPHKEPFGFTITAQELGGASSPAMSFEGPCLENLALAAHEGFW